MATSPRFGQVKRHGKLSKIIFQGTVDGVRRRGSSDNLGMITRGHEVTCSHSSVLLRTKSGLCAPIVNDSTMTPQQHMIGVTRWVSDQTDRETERVGDSMRLNMKIEDSCNYLVSSSMIRINVSYSRHERHFKTSIQTLDNVSEILLTWSFLKNCLCCSCPGLQC